MKVFQLRILHINVNQAKVHGFMGHTKSSRYALNTNVNKHVMQNMIVKVLIILNNVNLTAAVYTTKTLLGKVLVANIEPTAGKNVSTKELKVF